MKNELHVGLGRLLSFAEHRDDAAAEEAKELSRFVGHLMGRFEQLDEMLATADSGDAWSDYGAERANDVLRAFAADDWAQMISQWANRPEHWQGRAAYILGGMDSSRAVPLLLDIIRRGAGLARIGACDTLRTILQGRTDRLEVGLELKNIVAALEETAAAPWARSQAQLQEMLR